MNMCVDCWMSVYTLRRKLNSSWKFLLREHAATATWGKLFPASSKTTNVLTKDRAHSHLPCQIHTGRSSSCLQIPFTKELLNRLLESYKRGPECNHNEASISYMRHEKVWGSMGYKLRSGESQI